MLKVFNFFRNIWRGDVMKVERMKDYSSDDNESDNDLYKNSTENIEKSILKKFGPDSEHIQNMKDLGVNNFKQLGSGGFSLVKKGFSKKYGRDVAVKIILISDNNSYINKFLPKEMELWSELSREKHDNILCMLEHFEYDHFLYVVMEVAERGDLFERMRCGVIQEQKARSLFRGIISAVAYCHGKGIAHRDIKPENILLGKNDHVKLADFSFVTRDNPVSSERCGTPGMLAPEQKDCGYYNPFISDVWQIGITLYFMLFKETPYSSTRKNHLLTEIVQLKDVYKNVPFPKIRMLSHNCKDVIAGMLKINSSTRWTIQDIRQSNWLIT